MNEESNDSLPASLTREAKTVETMIGIYCAGHHRRRGTAGEGRGRLCDDCAALLDYVRGRLAKCPHGKESVPRAGKVMPNKPPSSGNTPLRKKKKPSCSKCEIHCYREPERTTIRKVMAYAGPRMALRHPIQTVKHLLQNRKKK